MNKIFQRAAKNQFYATSDGTGRDTYIAFDNGGNTLMYSPGCHSYTKGSMLPSPRGNPAHNIYVPPRTIHYENDGTGRDTYIKYMDGGLHALPEPRNLY